jgi:cyclic-di-GMP-binding protein
MIHELKIIFSDIGRLKKPDILCPDCSQIGIDSWFDNIHLTDKVKALQGISSFLKQSNHYILPIDERLSLLEKIHTPVISLVGNVKPQFLNTLMPLSVKDNKLVDLCLSIYQQIILAYSIILHEQLINKKKSWLFHKSLDTQITLSIQRQIRYLSQIVLTEFEVYRQADKAIWEKLYILFTFSEKKDFSNILIIDSLINEKTSIKVTFIQVLLLALSDPYHFNQQQIYYIYKHLANWAKLVDLVAYKKIKQEQYIAINLTDNYMPTFYPRGHQPDFNKALFIDTHKLSLQQLSDDSDSNIGFLSPQIKNSLLQKLKTSWSVYIDRTFDRNEFFSELKVVIGLDQVHYVLNKYHKPDWTKKAEYTSRISSADLFDYQQMMKELPFQNSKPDEINIEKIKIEPITFKNIEEDSFDSSNIIETFLTENESLNGLSLIWTKEYQLNLKIGEVIALSHEKKEQPDSWFIGVIRRIQHLQNEPLRVGVQLLSPSGAVPVAIKQEDQHKYHRALILPEFTLSNEPESLLADALTFTPGKQIEVESCHISQQKAFHFSATLLKEAEITPFYMRFSLKKKGLKK